MELVQTLAPIAGRAVHIEEIEPQEAGLFMRVLCTSAGLDDDLTQLLFEHILNDLVETEMLCSCEFHEALSGILTTSTLTELLVGAFNESEPMKMADTISKLYGGESYRPDESDWRLIRKNMSTVDFRSMLTHVMEHSCDKLHQIGDLISKVYDSNEEFEIAETLRLVLGGNWIMDIMPQKRKAARKALELSFVKPFPFAAYVVSDFCRDALSLSPIQAPAEYDTKPSDSSSADSDIESRGSLDDFVVDDEDESGSLTSEESEDSDSSEDSPIHRKKKKRQVSSSSSSSSDSSGTYRRKKKKLQRR
jgi:hypothetical protein